MVNICGWTPEPIPTFTLPRNIVTKYFITMMSNSFRTFNDISAQPATRPVRLRLACDACTTAKVRCSRTHPCERCEDNGQEKECYYSISRRHGKRARHRKTGSEMLRSSNTPSFSTSDFASAQYGTDFAWEDYSDTPGSSATKIDGEFEMLDSWASHSMDVTVDFDDINSMSWADPWKSLGLWSDTSPSQSSGMVSPDLSLSPEQITSIKRTSLGPSNILGNNMQGPKHSHNCEATALRLLRSLHCHSNTDQSANLCRQPHNTSNGMIMANQSCSMPSIDTVLSVNKTALGNLIPILKCPCARNPHIAMLHSAILSKVIFWYRVAVTARYHSDGVELRPMKIQLGMLDLDDEDQATLQRALLLSELRKAEKILETFDSFSVREDGIPSWHASALRNMREELQVIIQKIKRGQRDLA